jgi:hypothetical protein
VALPNAPMQFSCPVDGRRRTLERPMSTNTEIVRKLYDDF